MKKALAVALLMCGVSGVVHSGLEAQSAPPAAKPTPLQLQSLGQVTKADPFPPVNPKYFTASTPSIQTVDSFLHVLWGYDPNRIWRVEAIQQTDAPNVTKVVVFVSERTPNAPVQNAIFFVTPDGKHAIAGGSGVISFGEKPFAENRARMREHADGAVHGSVKTDLLLVEFADLQCPHCKEAQPMMKQLEHDYPNARIVYQSFPLVAIHPFAFEAAAYGACVTRQKNDAYFVYQDSVYDNQAALTPETAEQTLKNAVTKAGLDPVAISACAATQATKDQVNGWIKLAEEAGVDQTPVLAVNGRLMPLGGVPYETLKSIIDFTVAEDGVAAPGPALKIR